MSRLTYLDSSRGLAALIVLLSHFQLTVLPAISESPLNHSPFKLLFDGEVAVLYFFILSGFVLTRSFQSETNLNLASWTRFVFRRIFRIYPAFLLCLFLTWLYLKNNNAVYQSWLSQYWKSIPGFPDLLKQSLLLIRLPNDPELRLLPHDWTLSIEMAISLLLPFLVVVARINPYFVLIFSFCSIRTLHLDPFVWDFSLGVFIAQWTTNRNAFFLSRPLKIFLAFAAIVFLSLEYIYPQYMKVTDKMLIHHRSIGLGILLIVLLHSSSLQKIFSLKILSFLGKVSYSFYLFHLIILYGLLSLIPGLSSFTFLGIYLSVTIIVSSITFFIIEKPFIRYGNLFFNKK